MSRDSDCLFCKIVAGDIPAQVVHRDERTVAFMDIAPATRGHLLVVSHEHTPDIHEIGDDDLAAVHISAKRLADLMPERLGADGVNILQSSGRAAWQTVFHLHVHVIPRRRKDGLRGFFWPRTRYPSDAAGAEVAGRIRSAASTWIAKGSSSSPTTATSRNC